MQHRRHRRPLLVVAVIAALLSLLLASCGSDSSDDAADTTPDNDATSPTTEGDAPSGDLPDKITIAYQSIPNGDLIVKQQGLLEAALPDTEIEWKLFDSGGAVNEAFVSGDIDLGLAGSSPVSRGLSNGIGYRAVWIHAVIGEAESLVVTEDIESIEDLPGKKIATPFASTAHFSLLAALNEAGVDPSTVDIIDAEPDDIYAAWTRGDIDGAYVWNPNLARLIDEGGNVLITSAELADLGKTTYDLGLASTAFADAYPAAVEAWVAAQDQAVALIQDDLDAAAEIVAAELGITAEEAADQIGDLIFVRAAEQAGAEYLGGLLAENLFAAAEFNLEQGEIDEVQDPSVYEDGVDAGPAAAVG